VLHDDTGLRRERIGQPFGPDQFAPAFKEGFFLVPKLGQFEDANEVDLSSDPTVRARMRDVARTEKA